MQRLDVEVGVTAHAILPHLGGVDVQGVGIQRLSPQVGEIAAEDASLPCSQGELVGFLDFMGPERGRAFTSGMAEEFPSTSVKTRFRAVRPSLWSQSNSLRSCPAPKALQINSCQSSTGLFG